MRTEVTRLAVVPGLEIALGPTGEGAQSALIHIAAETPPHAPDGTVALEVTMSRDVLRSLVGAHSEAYRRAVGEVDHGGDIRIAVGAVTLVRRISDDIRHSVHRDGAKVLFLQGKVMELLAAGLSDPDADRDSAIVGNVQAILAGNPRTPPSMPELSRLVGLPSKKLNEIFRTVTGMTAFEWLMTLRLNHARDLLLNSDRPIREISDALGYSNANNFINAFTRHFSTSPGRLRSEQTNSAVFQARKH